MEDDLDDEAVYLEPADEAFLPDEPLRAVLPPDGDSGDPDQPGATFLDTEGELPTPVERLRVKLPGDDDDDDVDTDDDSSFELPPRRQ